MRLALIFHQVGGKTIPIRYALPRRTILAITYLCGIVAPAFQAVQPALPKPSDIGMRENGRFGYAADMKLLSSAAPYRHVNVATDRSSIQARAASRHDPSFAI